MIKKSLLVSFFLAFTLGAFSQVTTLSFETYLNLIEERLPQLKLNATRVISAENNLLSARGINDVSLAVNSGALGKLGSASIPTEGSGIRLGVGANSTIAASGTRLAMEISQDALFAARQPHDDFYAPAITVTVTQPLLKNILGILDRYPIKYAESSLTLAKLQRQIDDASVIFAYQKMYFEWIMLEKLLESFELVIKEADAFEAQVYRRMQSGLVDNDAYQNAKRQTLQYKDYYAKYAENLKTLRISINYFLPIESKKPNMDLWRILFEEALVDSLVPVSFYETAHGKISDEMQYRAQLAVKAMKNNILPSLDLFGTLNVRGTNPAGNYLTSFGHPSNIDYFVGLKFSYPIGNKVSKANLLEAENTLNAVIYECQQLSKDYTVQMKTICSRFDLNKSLLASNLEQIHAIESRLNTQLKKFEQGRVESDDIITTRLELVSSQIDRLNLEYQIITALFDYAGLLALQP